MKYRSAAVFAFATCLLLSIALFAESAFAQIPYSESGNGDLGGPGAATDIGMVLLGANSVSGTLENQATGFDPDAFSFQVPGGLEVTEISLSSLTGDSHFLAINDGPVSQFNAGGNLIATLISDSDVGANLLNGTLNSFGGSGIAGSLGPGSYSVWLQETDGSDVDYVFSITAVSTTSIPEPGSLALFGSSLLFAALRRTRSRLRSA